MKMDMATALAASNAFNKCGNVTGKTGYAIYKNAKIFSDHVAPFNQVRDNLINKYGEEDETGNKSISEASDNWPEFLKELEPIVSMVDEIEPYRIDVVDLPPIEALSAQEYSLLEYILTKPVTDEGEEEDGDKEGHTDTD